LWVILWNSIRIKNRIFRERFFILRTHAFFWKNVVWERQLKQNASLGAEFPCVPRARIRALAVRQFCAHAQPFAAAITSFAAVPSRDEFESDRPTTTRFNALWHFFTHKRWRFSRVIFVLLIYSNIDIKSDIFTRVFVSVSIDRKCHLFSEKKNICSTWKSHRRNRGVLSYIKL